MNLHVFLTPFTHESRCLKESASLVAADAVDEVLFAALWEEGLEEHQRYDDRRRVWRVPLATRRLPRHLLSQLAKYVEWVARILHGTRRERIDVVHAHSLAALPVGVALKRLRGARLIYDPHELETEKNGLTGLRQRLARRLERRLIGEADAVIVVNDAIADWYHAAYPAMPRPYVVRNVPEARPSFTAGPPTVLRDRLGLADGEILFIYQGALSPGRGVERLLEVFSRVKPDRHLVFMGYGPLEARIRQQAEARPNIHFVPAVPPSEVLTHTASADVGFCLIENTCLSYYYSLPNKLFEYVLSGLAVMINDFPEQRAVLDRFQCGWCAPEDPAALAALIDGLSPEAIAEKRANAAQAPIGWAQEAEALVESYRVVGGTR